MKKLLAGLIVLGLALSVVGCGTTSSGGDGDNGGNGDGYGITGFIGVWPSGSDIPYMYNGTADTIDDAVIKAYSDSSYSTLVDSYTTYCASLEGTDPVAYSLTVPGGAIYYLKATQRVVYNNNSTTHNHFVTFEVTVGSSDVVVTEFYSLTSSF